MKSTLIKCAGLAAGLALAGAVWADRDDRDDNRRDTPPGHSDPDVVLINGNIHTMDASSSIARGVAIKDGQIIEVTTHGHPHAGPRTKVIDLRGRTVVPGMIEAHVHFVSLAIRPGYHVVIENAQSIAEVQAMLAARRADVPPGQFITAMGGWHPNMFAEHRLPTLAELDVAVPDRPVFVFQQFSGPARTNTLGKAFFEHPTSPTPTALPLLPVVVGADGSMSGIQATTALYDLRVLQTFDDKKRSTVDAMRYATSVGITAVLDEVGFPDSGPLAPTQILANFDNFHMYDSWLAVRQEGNALIRLQANFLHNQNDITLPELTQRLKNQFQLFGDDMMMTGAIGEWGAPGDGVGDVWLQAQRLVGQAGWRNNNRALSLNSFAAEVAGYETVNRELTAAGHPDGITKWRWRIDHVPVVTPDLLKRLHDLGGAVQMGAFSYGSGTPGTAPRGAPFKTILTDPSHIKAGIHLDGVHIAPLNPWFGVYYASTGKNALGQLINDGEQISREQAVRLYTRENAWFLNMEDKLGSIEAGKLADLVVLNDDYVKVSDEGLKRIGSVLTLVNGKVVHDAGVVRFDRSSD
jgi:predicted amidohydrolase YtcJ